jgi:hypothetical protein
MKTIALILALSAAAFSVPAEAMRCDGGGSCSCSGSGCWGRSDVPQEPEDAEDPDGLILSENHKN